MIATLVAVCSWVSFAVVRLRYHWQSLEYSGNVTLHNGLVHWSASAVYQSLLACLWLSSCCSDSLPSQYCAADTLLQYGRTPLDCSLAWIADLRLRLLSQHSCILLAQI